MIKLPTHLLIHFIVSVIAGLLVVLINPYINAILVVALAIAGGVFIDVDHFFDYFIAFGINFKFEYFFKGYAFQKSDKVYEPLHSWEIVLLVPLVFILYPRFGFLFFALILGLFFHLISDVLLNNFPFLSYSFIYRLINNFELKNLVSKNHLLKHMEDKKQLKKRGII
jgi:hypothetical protein